MRWPDPARRGSARRSAGSRLRPSSAARRAHAGRGAAPPVAAGFDVIAELKLRSPAAGCLGDRSRTGWVANRRLCAGRRGRRLGAHRADEVRRLAGRICSEAAAALAPLGVPAMRKDFLVDPYQVLEARAAGAGGVLVILRMLTPRAHCGIAGCRRPAGPVRAAGGVRRRGSRPSRTPCWRRAARGDHPHRHQLPRSADLAGGAGAIRRSGAACSPRVRSCVAESGVTGPDDACEMRRLGYRLALIGTALMGCDDPAALLAKILAEARTVQL